MSLRILFAVHGPADPSTAVYANVQRRSEYLRSAGHTVDVLMVEDLRVRWLPARLDPLVLPLSLARLKLRAYDVVVFHSYLGWAFHALRGLVDRAHRVVTITMFHGLEPLYHQAVSVELARHGLQLSARFRLLHQVLLPRLLRLSTRRSDGVFCLNREEADYLVAQRWARADRVFVVRNGFAPDEVAMGPRDYQRGRRFLMIARWLPAKGIRYLVEAFTTLAHRNPDVELVCAGTGADADTVLSSFPAHVRPRVTVLPRLDRAGIREQLLRADAFVFPSLYEGFGIAVLEALASGLPVISTNVGLATDILQHQRDALVVPVADAGLLADAMERVARDEGLRRRLGEAASAVARPLTWWSAGAQFDRKVLEVVASRGPGAARRGTLRILFAIHAPSNPRTAVFMCVSSQAHFLRRLGHVVDIIGPEALGADRFGGFAPLLVGPLLVLKGHLATYDLVVFHSHQGWTFHALRPLIDRRGRVHSVTAFHGLEPLYHEMEEKVLARHGRRYSARFRFLHRVVLNRLLRFSCRRSHGIFCLNTTERDWLISHGWCRPEYLAVVANGVEEEFLTPLRPGRPADRLISLAHWLPRKGIRELIEAFTLLASNNARLQLVCAGTGESEDAVKAAFPPGIAERVLVLPSVGRHELLALLQSADIFVFPSAFEGFSGALLEGMASGLAVVATPAGAAPDLLADGDNALIVPYGDAAALARAIQRLIDDPQLRSRIGHAAAIRASQYTWPIVNAEYASALMAAHGRPAPVPSAGEHDAG